MSFKFCLQFCLITLNLRYLLRAILTSYLQLHQRCTLDASPLLCAPVPLSPSPKVTGERGTYMRLILICLRKSVAYTPSYLQ